MPTASLSAGQVEYADTGGDGPVLVLLHGVNMSGSLWDGVVTRMPPDVRCITPTLPLGSHRRPMARADLVTHRGVSALVGELLEALDLTDVTLVLNDWGGAQFLLADGPNERVAAAALVACEAFDNFPQVGRARPSPTAPACPRCCGWRCSSSASGGSAAPPADGAG